MPEPTPAIPRFRCAFAVSSLLTLLGVVSPAMAADPAKPNAELRFDRDIRPILSDKCFSCHGPDEKHRGADVRLDLQAFAFKDYDGIRPFVPGDLEESEAWRLISSNDKTEQMPPPKAKKPLTEKEKALIKRWIEQGAKWTGHWSFNVPAKVATPSVKQKDWVRNPVDAFILARLESEGLKPQASADRRTLIRRLSFDLRGMPPTLAEIKQFVEDKAPDAYEKLVDRMLASPAFGERMAVTWLDAARYGDTSVFHADGPRDMWAWRDWVVKAYNTNKPFDQFTIEQLAGDLLPDATVEQKLASGFNRNNGTTDEGGAIAEEYRVEYAVDRVKTTSMVWLGMSMECAQCHDHKYDPISMKDYYSFYAFFNISSDKGMQTRRGNAAPMISLPDPNKVTELPKVREQIKTAQAALDKRMKDIGPAFDAWLTKAEQSPKATQPLPGGMLAHFPLDEGKGKQSKGDIDPKRVANFKGKPAWVAGKVGKGIKLNGGDWLDAGDVANFERTDSFSYGCWVYVENDSAGTPIARMNDRNNYRGWDLYIASRKVAMHLINAWPGNALKVTTKQALKPKQWYHLFVTYDGSSKAKGVTIYVNGKPWEWNIEQNGLTGTTRSNTPLFIGSRNPGSRFKGVVDDVRIYPRKLSRAEVAALAGADTLGPILAKKRSDRTAAENQLLRDHYLNSFDKTYTKLTKDLAKLKAKEADLQKPITTVMVMGDLGKPRDTFILNRGAYDAPTKTKVEPNTPTSLPPMAEGLPRNRLGMAKWLFQDNHPLTARVAANRMWQMFFGIGLVDSPADLGAQGSFPSHPKLLDYLAIWYRDNAWDTKALIKLLVTSATYRQQTHVTPTLLARDRTNRLLARGPRFRLQGEFIRDNALYLSGLLVNQMGGPGVKPYQPPGLWAQVGLSGRPIFKRDNGEKLYRRSLYSYWKRSAPPPNMVIFDAPTREKCTVQRPRTNTPLQALVTLNDVQFVEAARNFAQRTMKEGGKTPEERTAWLFEMATARKPNTKEMGILLGIYRKAFDRYLADAEAAKKLLSFGDSKRDESLVAAEHAAWTMVCSAVLNLDEVLTRG